MEIFYGKFLQPKELLRVCNTEKKTNQYDLEIINRCLSQHGTIIRTIIRTGMTCKKIPCYMRNSACRWSIVKKAKIF